MGASKNGFGPEDMLFSAWELEQLNQIGLAVLAASGVDEMSNAVMELLPALIPHDKSFFERKPTRGGSRRRFMSSLTMTDEELSLYAETYSTLDYTAWYMRQEDVEVYRDSDVASEQIIESSRIFTEWVRGMGMHFVCGNAIRNERGYLADLTLFRTQDAGDFTDRELFLLLQVTRQMRAWFGSRYHATPHGSDGTGRRGKPDIVLGELTAREAEVARLACTGISVREIASQLSISYSTARRHLANIYAKFGVDSRVQLIARLS